MTNQSPAPDTLITSIGVGITGYSEAVSLSLLAYNTPLLPSVTNSVGMSFSNEQTRARITSNSTN